MVKTIKDIANALNLSTATVSRALNNCYGVNPKTRERVLKTVRKLKYSPNIVARNLVMSKTNIIGLVVPDIKHSFFPEIANGIENVLNRKKFQLMLCQSGESLEKKEWDVVKTLLVERRVDGLIIAPVGIGSLRVCKYLQDNGILYVTVTRRLKNLKSNYVICNDQKGSRLAVEYLIKLGHRRIGYICGRLDISPGRDRLLGYRKTLSDYGIAYDPKLVKGGGFNLEDGQQAMKEFIQLPECPTAIFAVNDLNAIGAMKLAEKEGLKVPQDVAVVGFDDIMWSSLIKPSLTTIAQPKRELGEIAAELLLEKISSKDTCKVEKVVLEPKLIVRESSGRCLSWIDIRN